MTKKCAVNGCKNQLYALGYCNTHYARIWRNGDLSLRKNPNGTALAWLKKALKRETDKCILFPFPVGSHGYGQFRIAGEDELAHRFVCRKAHGKSPRPNDDAAHSCGRRRCCNKRHIRWAPRSENMADRLIHGTDDRGEKHSLAKLTSEKVLKIRMAKGSQKSIAKQFGVAQQTVSAIKLKKEWAWL